MSDVKQQQTRMGSSSSSSTLARSATRSAQRLAVDSGLLYTMPLPEGQGVDVEELLEEGAPQRNRRDDDVVLHYKANMSTPDWLPMHPEGVLFFVKFQEFRSGQDGPSVQLLLKALSEC